MKNYYRPSTFGFCCCDIEEVLKIKKSFVEHQDAAYPNFSSWKTGEDPSVLQKEIAEQSSQLKSVFDKQEKLACLSRNFHSWLLNRNISINMLKNRMLKQTI